MAALLNQYLVAQSKPALGFFPTTAYSLAKNTQTYPPFHDITSGTNGQYSAASGWDPVSGLGTPDLWNIARDLAGAPGTPATSTATPTSTPTVTNTPTATTGTGATSTPTATATATSTP